MNLERIKTLLNSTTQDSSLLKRIDDYLTSLELQKSSAKAPSHKPSSVGTPCLRKTYYAYFRILGTPTDAKGLRIFAHGNAVEDMVMGWFKAIDLHIPYRGLDGLIPMQGGKPNPQFPITSPRWRIAKGYIDNVAVLDGKLVLMEIKTSNNNKFRALKAPEPGHLEQVGIYLACFNDLLAAGEFAHIPELKGFAKAEAVHFLYYNKDNSDMKAFAVRPTPLIPVILNLDRKLARANQYIDKKVLPPKTPDRLCQYCPYLAKCNKNENVD